MAKLKNFGLTIVLFTIIVQVFCRVQTLNLLEGQICKRGEEPWICKSIRDCPNAAAGLRRGKFPQTCGLLDDGKTPIVCCEPSKSEKMCHKYGEAVFLEGGFSMYNSNSSEAVPLGNAVMAKTKEFPHMALIGYESQNGTEWDCGGSLISDRYVITAASCLNHKKLGEAKYVRLGDYDISTNKDDDFNYAQTVDFNISKTIVHPGYNESSLYFDIMLIRLDRNVDFNAYVRPICLQTGKHLGDESALVSGWGPDPRDIKPSLLQKLKIQLTNDKMCHDMYKFSKIQRLKDGIRKESQFCGRLTTGGEICEGHIGDPLQVKLARPHCMYSLLGVTSSRRSCGGYLPNIYTRVSHFVPWIESVVWPASG